MDLTLKVVLSEAKPAISIIQTFQSTALLFTSEMVFLVKAAPDPQKALNLECLGVSRVARA